MNTLIIEFNTWHGECLPPVIHLLASHGDNLTLICPTSTFNALTPAEQHQVHHVPSHGRGLPAALRVMRLIHSLHPDQLYLNTAQGSGALWLSLLLTFSRIPLIGTIHNLTKLQSSLGQRLISHRISAYYVLAPYLLPHLQQLTTLPAHILPTLPDNGGPALTIPPDTSLAIIPGSVDFNRRDYASLIPLAQSRPDLTFVILGDISRHDGPRLLSLISTLPHVILNPSLPITLPHPLPRFILFSQFIPRHLFDAFLRSAKYLLPLIPPAHTDLYLTRKVSGTFILSARFHLPLLIPPALAPLANSYPTSPL